MEDETEENVMSHSLCKRGNKNSGIEKWETPIFPEASIISMGGQCFLKHKSDEKVTKLKIAVSFINLENIHTVAVLFYDSTFIYFR